MKPKPSPELVSHKVVETHLLFKGNKLICIRYDLDNGETLLCPRK